MPLLQRIVKPSTQRGKRALLKREPQLNEDVKRAMFIRGIKTSDVVLKCMRDMAALKRPNGMFYNRKNDVHPFEDATKIERLSKKHDSSLFMFGSHNKKRPHNVVMGRTFDYQILDMVELGIDSYKGLQDFKNAKIATGTKPIILFLGDFEQHEYQRLKSLLIDFYRGTRASAVRLAGLEHVLMFSAIDGKVHMRSYRTLLKKSGTKVPYIELEEIGPSVDFTLRRTKLASSDLFKLAKKQPKELKKKKVKNVSKNKLGSKLGRIHMQRQDLGRLQTRKMKGLKKSSAQLKLDKKLKNLKRKRENEEKSTPGETKKQRQALTNSV